MPFITEEIWQAIYDGKPPLKSIALAQFPLAGRPDPDPPGELTGEEALDHINFLILEDLIVTVRNLRAELKIEPRVKVPIEVFPIESFAHESKIRDLLEQNRGAIERLANVEKILFVESSPAKLPGARSSPRFDVHVVYERKIDVAEECERLKKELEKIEKELANNQRQMGNTQFLAKAPANVVEGLRRRAQELTVLREKTQSKLKELGCS